MVTASSALFHAISAQNDQLLGELKANGLDQTHDVHIFARNHMGDEVRITSFLKNDASDLLVLVSRNDQKQTSELLVQSPGGVNLMFRIVRKQGPSSPVGFVKS